jgi:hypothetical protein
MAQEMQYSVLMYNFGRAYSEIVSTLTKPIIFAKIPENNSEHTLVHGSVSQVTDSGALDNVSDQESLDRFVL